MYLAVVGSRSFDDYELLKKILSKINISKIISGGADGADKLAERYARDNNIELQIIYADWNQYGRRAGFIRNVEIWENATSGVAFWDGISSGTKHSFEISRKQNKKLLVVEYNTNKVYYA